MFRPCSILLRWLPRFADAPRERRRPALVAAWLGVCLALPSLTCLAQGTDPYLDSVKPLIARQCVACHGATQQKGGLRLDTAAAMHIGGDHGPAITPGKPDQSLLSATLLGTHEEVSRMPYKRPPLSSEEIEVIQVWIRAGAPHPKEEVPSSDRHWAFDPPKEIRPPQLRHDPFPRDGAPPNPVDRFILARLQRDELAPSPLAERTTQLRRLALDLTGLPPTPEEIRQFLADQRPDAYERAVDRFLASPHYGERWGRWWLDAARYADSNGYSIDSPRSIWPYRDWVVRAFNQGMPFDQFTLWQLAGDLLPTHALPPDVDRREPLLATGFHRNTQVNHEGGIDPEQFRVESVVDRVNTTATVWLGVTFACAQCHDHKFDPFTLKDYYSLFAYFNSTENDGHGNASLQAENTIDLTTPDLAAQRTNQLALIDRLTRETEAWAESELRPGQPAWESALTEPERLRLSEKVRDALNTPRSARTPEQAKLAWTAYRDAHPEWKRRREPIARLRNSLPSPTLSLVMRERPTPRPTTVFIKGDFTRPGDPVPPATPASLHPPAATGAAERGTRLELARWIIAPENPLTARVIVNRYWQQFFGRGLVETENDFGTQGTPPSHPELLDWLAVRFRSSGWDTKAMHRLIVTSRTYRQSSHARPDLDARDPRNLLLARQNRFRLDAELVRDVALRSSGLLDPRLGGPPVHPPQPTGLGAFTQNSRDWKPDTGGNRYRRGIYTFLWRTTLHPALGVFDSADGYVACTRRIRSNTPLQALTLLNDPAWHEFATHLASELQAMRAQEADRVRAGFLRTVGREPKDSELGRLLELLRVETAESGHSTAWLTVSRVLLNLDETITRE